MKTIYLTGTVNDMKAEYEAICEQALPKINSFLSEYGEEAVICGLNYDSDDEACRRELKSCFREMKKDGTYFVVLMGDKYGDIPSNEVTDGLLEKSGISSDDNVKGKSVFDIELTYAAMANLDKTLFYMREPLNKKELNGTMRKIYIAGFGEGGKVKKLKAAVKEAEGAHIHEYALSCENGIPTKESAEKLAHRIAEDIIVLITDDLKKQPVKPEIKEESEKEEVPKIPQPEGINTDVKIEKIDTPIWDSVQQGEKYNPEKLRNEAVQIAKNAMLIEQKDPETSGDMYDESLEMFKRIRDDVKVGNRFNDELDKKKIELVTDECIRDIGLTYNAYARIEFNAKNFDGASAWGKQAIEAFTKYQKKYPRLQIVIDLSNVWMLMGAALANSGNMPEAIDLLCAAMSCFDVLIHAKDFKAPNDFMKKYQSIAQMAHNICINEKSGECAKKWLKFCQQQSFNLSKMGDNQGMINYVNFSIALFEYQIYTQKNLDNVIQYVNMIHEMSQLFLRQRNGEMLQLISDKGRNLLEVAGDNERVEDIVCSIITLQANYFFSSGQQENALKNYKEVIEKRSKYEESSEWGKRLVIAADNARIASAYTELNRLDEAKEHYEKAISILEKLDNCYTEEKLFGELASAYMNYSVCLGKRGDTKTALEKIKKASELIEGKKLKEQGLMLLRRRIRRMYAIASDSSATQMYSPELMKAAKSEIERLQKADGVIKQNDFETGAIMIEKALVTLKELNVIDIVLPSESYAANLTVCGSLYDDKLNNKEKAQNMYKQAWAVLNDMERDGLILNPNLVNNLKKRMGIN